MAAVAKAALNKVVSFDIFEGNILDGENIMTDNLTQEEKEEVYVLVNELESVNSHELMDFATQENAAKETLRHKAVTAVELDHLANKNSAEQTQYQT